jgi:hypothetical protein
VAHEEIEMEAKKATPILFLAAILAVTPVLAGVVFEIDVTDHEQSPPRTESIQAAVEGQKLKMGVAGGGRGGEVDLIYRGEQREIVVVDHERKAYQLMDEKTMRQLAGQVSGAMQQMQEALENVPEEQRAAIEQMMKQRMPRPPPAQPESELRKTGESAIHNGYPCVKYVLLRDGRTVSELWVTDWSNVEGGSEVVEAFEEMAEFFREMLDSLPDMAGGPGFDHTMFTHMKGLGGFPGVTRELGADGSLEGESVLRSAKRRTIAAAEFEPPAGYQRQSLLGE